MYKYPCSLSKARSWLPYDHDGSLTRTGVSIITCCSLTGSVMQCVQQSLDLAGHSAPLAFTFPADPNRDTPRTLLSFYSEAINKIKITPLPSSTAVLPLPVSRVLKPEKWAIMAVSHRRPAGPCLSSHHLHRIPVSVSTLWARLASKPQFRPCFFRWVQNSRLFSPLLGIPRTLATTPGKSDFSFPAHGSPLFKYPLSSPTPVLSVQLHMRRLTSCFSRHRTSFEQD